MRVFLGVCTFLLVATVALADVVEHFPCENRASNSTCLIHEVRIDPCAEAASKLPCKIKRGRTANISFDYTAGFEAADLLGQVYWVSPEGDLPLAGMNTRACEHTTCPVQSPTRQTYSYTLQTAKKFPAMIYEIKWVLNDPATTSECCFTTKIRIAK